MNNKVAVITGSSSGIGKAICGLLLEKGYVVYGISKKPSVFSTSGFTWIQADLTEVESYNLIASQIKDSHIDLLVNNAGVAFEQAALDFSKDSFLKVFNINFQAPIILTKTLRNKLKESVVINISSVSDRLAGKSYALYCSSKAALNIYFDVLALEEKELKIVSILPSYVDTPLLRNLQKGKSFSWEETLKPDQVADFISNIINDNNILSGAKIIVVNNALKEDLVYQENLWGYNVDTKKLKKLD